MRLFAYDRSNRYLRGVYLRHTHYSGTPASTGTRDGSPIYPFIYIGGTKTLSPADFDGRPFMFSYPLNGNWLTVFVVNDPRDVGGVPHGAAKPDSTASFFDARDDILVGHDPRGNHRVHRVGTCPASAASPVSTEDLFTEMVCRDLLASQRSGIDPERVTGLAGWSDARLREVWQGQFGVAAST